VHVNRLKVYHDDRDAFYLRHNLKPKDAATSTSQHSSDSAKTTDDTWYPIDKLLDLKRVGKKTHFLVQRLHSQSSKSWEPDDNMTQYAIAQYFIAKHAKTKRRNKR